MKLSVEGLSSSIVDKYRQHPPMNVFTVAISGIDASGKGYTASQLKLLLEAEGLRVALLSVDDWQMPKSISLLKQNPAENFYHNSFRWTAFFDSLFFPLQKNKSIFLTARLVKLDKDDVYTHHYDFSNIDIILLEGIFLFKRDFNLFFDYKIWIDCSFETGLKRALQRNQEGISNLEMVNDYNTCYYPAQRYHFEKDKPKENADIIFLNE